MPYTSPPSIAGTPLPRPTASTRTREDVEGRVALGNGAERRYVTGYRWVYSLTWASLTEAQVGTVTGLITPRGGFAYVHTDGTTGTVYAASPPAITPIGGTDPVKHTVTVHLREPGVRPL